MKMHTFKGGVHPPEKKGFTANKAIESVYPSTNMVSIPLTMGGKPNELLVSVGDTVTRGQKIADNTDCLSAPVHSSISGKVKKIETKLLADGSTGQCIIIEGDGQNIESFMPKLDPFTCSKTEALERVREAGIVGMGGAAFPTHVKLSPPKEKPISVVIANGAECEPYLTIDDMTMQERATNIIDGLAIATKIVGAPKALLAIEDNKKHLLPILNEAIEKSGNTEISLVLTKTKYPQGGEKSLIKAVLKKEVPSCGIPADIGCVVLNVNTLCAISDAFRLGKPLIDRPLTISGAACENPKNIVVPIGTVLADLIPETISLKEDLVKILSGGPMMGVSLPNTSFPIAKNTSGILFLNKKETDLTTESQCISCGRCIDVCSCRITPVMIVKELAAGNMAEALRYGLMDCVECGSCVYVCPAHVQLIQRIRTGKQIRRSEIAQELQIQEKNLADCGKVMEADCGCGGDK
ncbi:MAG: electron transport complex subunit RsxC [Spirochaetota bacterium]|jgi:electron transport complex protein RnfC|nr:electron transport complex subunit RsxC [Spirochaetota bacterium]NMA56949.1 electron transport complex subunit RsxC [Treponema sp.]